MLDVVAGPVALVEVGVDERDGHLFIDVAPLFGGRVDAHPAACEADVTTELVPVRRQPEPQRDVAAVVPVHVAAGAEVRERVGEPAEVFLEELVDVGGGRRVATRPEALPVEEPTEVVLARVAGVLAVGEDDLERA